MEISSQKGVGTLVRVALPCDEAMPAPAPAPRPAPLTSIKVRASAE
jgi:hypothetical protein